MTYLKSLLKAIKYPIIVGLGMLIASFIGNFPAYADITIGAALILVYDIIKHRLGVKLP